MGVRVSVASGISGAVAATAARGKDGRERGREGWGRTHVADVRQVFVAWHAERSQQRIRQKGGRAAKHGSQGLCGVRENVSASPRGEGQSEYVRRCSPDLPFTPERSSVRSTFRCTRSRFWVISLRMSRCRARNSCPSNTDDGGFFDLSVSAAPTRDCRQKLIASWAKSSNMAGYWHR